MRIYKIFTENRFNRLRTKITGKTVNGTKLFFLSPKIIFENLTSARNMRFFPGLKIEHKNSNLIFLSKFQKPTFLYRFFVFR